MKTKKLILTSAGNELQFCIPGFQEETMGNIIATLKKGDTHAKVVNYPIPEYLVPLMEEIEIADLIQINSRLIERLEVINAVLDDLPNTLVKDGVVEDNSKVTVGVEKGNPYIMLPSSTGGSTWEELSSAGLLNRARAEIEIVAKVVLNTLAIYEKADIEYNYEAEFEKMLLSVFPSEQLNGGDGTLLTFAKELLEEMR